MTSMLFDTNLWSYLGKETDADRTAAVLRAAGHRALVNTQMLTEALRTSDVGDRTRIVDMMASRHWLKLTSAMDAHAVEMTSEVRRLRPEWLRSIPKTDRLHSFRAYWTKVYWREARTEPEAVLARIAASSVGDDADDAIARVQAANKPGWPFEPGDLLSAALSATTAEDHPDRDPGSRLGWPTDTPVLWWRVNARDVWWAQMCRELDGPITGHRDTSMLDSFGAYVDLPTLRRERESFNRFFLFDIEGWNVPRAWWQGTVEVLQVGKKLSAGNGADASHASYLPDCDYLLTTDKAYADVLRAAAATLGAPQGGAVVLVKPHRDGWLAALAAALQQLPPPRVVSPTRVTSAGMSPPIGNGPGQISPAQVRRNTKRGHRLSAIEGQARLVAEDGTAVADLVAVSISSDPSLRPDGMKAQHFGALRVLLCDGARGPVAARANYVLEWLGSPTVAPIKIWVVEVEDHGVLATFAVNSKL